MITYLTPAQWRHVHAHFAEWQTRLFSGEWDEEAAKTFVAWLYTEFLHKPVPQVIICPNPMVAEIMPSLLKIITEKGSGTPLWDTLGDTLDGTLGHMLDGTLWDTLRGTLEGTLWDTLRDTLGDTLQKIIKNLQESKIPYFPFFYSTTIFDGGYNCWMSYCVEEGFTTAPKAKEFFTQVFKANLGFFLPFEHVAFICPPPKIHKNIAVWEGWTLTCPKDLISTLPSFPITSDLSVRVVENQVKAFVRDTPVSSCRYAIVTVAPDITATSMDEILAKYALPENESKKFTREAGLTLADEVFVHASNLQAWVEHDYNVNLIDSRLAWPLLRQLRPYDPHANDAFLQAVHERWTAGSPQSRIALEEMVPDAVTELRQHGVLENKEGR